MNFMYIPQKSKNYSIAYHSLIHMNDESNKWFEYTRIILITLILVYYVDVTVIFLESQHCYELFYKIHTDLGKIKNGFMNIISSSAWKNLTFTTL